jgi:hypothetical protein
MHAFPLPTMFERVALDAGICICQSCCVLFCCRLTRTIGSVYGIETQGLWRTVSHVLLPARSYCWHHGRARVEVARRQTMRRREAYAFGLGLRWSAALGVRSCACQLCHNLWALSTYEESRVDRRCPGLLSAPEVECGCGLVNLRLSVMLCLQGIIDLLAELRWPSVF